MGLLDGARCRHHRWRVGHRRRDRAPHARGGRHASRSSTSTPTAPPRVAAEVDGVGVHRRRRRPRRVHRRDHRGGRRARRHHGPVQQRRHRRGPSAARVLRPRVGEDRRASTSPAPSTASAPRCRCMRDAGGCIVNHASVSGVRPDALRGSVLRGEGGGDLAHDGRRARVRAGDPRQLRVARVHRHRAHRRRARRPEPARRGRGRARRSGGWGARSTSPTRWCSSRRRSPAYVTGHNLVVDGGSYLPNSQADAILRQFGM